MLVNANWTDAVDNRPAQLLDHARWMNRASFIHRAWSGPCIQDRQHAWAVIDNAIQCVMCHLSSEDYYASNNRR